MTSVSRLTARLTARFTPERLPASWTRVATRISSRVTFQYTTHVTPHLSRITNRDRRTIMIGAGVVILGLIVFRGLPAWRAWTDAARLNADVAVQRLMTAQRYVATAPYLAEAADSIAQTYYGVIPALLPGDSPAQSAAALASHVSEVAEEAGIQLGTVQLVTDSVTTNTEMYRVRVRADGAGDVTGLTTFVRLLEGGGALILSVKTLTISQSDPMAAPERAESLRISFVVEGIARRSDR